MREEAIFSYSATDVSTRMAQGEELCLLDVREEFEREICTIKPMGKTQELHISMRQIDARLKEIPQQMPVVVYCHTGRRSATVTQFLRQQGYDKVFNLRGGVDAWADEVEPQMARY